MRAFLLYLLPLFVLPLAAVAEVRLAILSEPGMHDEETLLTAELSHSPVVLLERTEIARVLAEQRLPANGLAADQLPRVGRILGADGVIFLSASPGKEGPALNLRIVAVHPGVIVASSRDESMPKDAAAWSRDTAARITGLLPKLAVRAEAAVPVSVVNLRATRTRPEAAELEREWTLLLTHRLAHEPAIFVLERERLETLQGEKINEAAAPFWTGRWLIDGAIEQDVADANRLSITIHLRPSSGGEPATIHRECRRDESTAAVDALAIEITRRLQQEPTSEPWSAEKEASRFWGEARWAFDHEAFARAAIAAEAAWALGEHTTAVMALRIRAELLAARPELIVPYRYPKEYVSQYLQERNLFWRADLPQTRGYRTPNVLENIFEAMPPEERALRLDRTLHGLELYRDHFADHLDQPGELALATETLTIGGAMLEWFRQNQAGWNETIEALAASLREIDALATGHAAALSHQAKSADIAQFWLAKVALTPLWANDPAQTLATYRSALRAPVDGEIGAELRVTLVHSQDLFPTLAGAERNALLSAPSSPSSSSGSDPREPAPKGWAAFVEELCQSPFAGDRFTGLCIQHDNAPRAEQPPIAAKSQAAFWAERAVFAHAQLPFKYWDLLRAAEAKELAHPFSTDFLIYLLRESTPIEHESFWQLCQPRSFTKEQAAMVYEAILAYNARVRARADARWMLLEINARTEELLLRFPDLRHAEPVGDALKVTRYWHPYLLPEFQDGSLSHLTFDFKEAIHAEGRLWIFGASERSRREVNASAPRFIFGIDLKTFETETISFPAPPPLATPINNKWGGFDFAVAADYIFVCGENSLSRYDRRAKTWHYYPQLPGVFAQPWRIGDRLYIQVNNPLDGFKGKHFGELVELDVKTDAVTLLASDRRQPAESPLDTWPFDTIGVRRGPAGQIFFRGFTHQNSHRYNYAAYEPATRQWAPLEEPAWKSVPGEEPAYMAMANGDAPWTIENNALGTNAWLLKSGDRTIPFRCEFTEKDRALLAKNGSDPSVEVIERNLFPGLPMVPLACVTPEGIAFSQVFRMPGFWFIPTEDLPPGR